MNVVAYFNHPKNADIFPARLIRWWCDSWTRHGFEPVLVTEQDAMRHPQFEATREFVDTLPTACGREYERACWLRWLAFEASAPAVFCDYDVANYGFSVGDVPVTRHLGISCLHDDNGASSACVFAEAFGIRLFIARFREAAHHVRDWRGQPHVSDMWLFRDTHPRPDDAPCVKADSPAALTTPLVHFQNDTVPERWKGANRWKAMRWLRVKRFSRMIFT